MELALEEARYEVAREMRHQTGGLMPLKGVATSILQGADAAGGGARPPKDQPGEPGSRFNKRTRAEHESTTQLDGRQCPRHRARVGRPVHHGSGSTVCSCSMHPSVFKCSVVKVRRPAARGVPIWMIMHRS